MTDIHAAIGRTQLKHLLKWSKKRQDNAMTLSSQLQNVVTPIIPNGFSHVFHQYTIRVSKNRDTFADKLSKAGVGNSVYYPTQVHKLPSFKSELSLPQTQLATETVLSLPVHPSLTKRDLNRIINTANSLIKEI
jgi:dTDP-4-amino-4,6-dideoxygalactose transaminase